MATMFTIVIDLLKNLQVIQKNQDDQRKLLKAVVFQISPFTGLEPTASSFDINIRVS